MGTTKMSDYLPDLVSVAWSPVRPNDCCENGNKSYTTHNIFKPLVCLQHYIAATKNTSNMAAVAIVDRMTSQSPK